MIQIAYIVTAIVLFAGLLLLGTRRPSTISAQSDARGRRFSWMILGVYLGSTIFNIQTREMTALASQGLSIQNRVQVGIVVIALIWSSSLIATRRVRQDALFSGPGYWIFWLIILYVVSTGWSAWPSLTFFRTVEVAAFWILTTHIFATANWPAHFERFLWIALAMHLLRGYLALFGFLEGLSSDNHVLGIMRSNSASLLAGLMILWTIHKCFTESWFSHSWKVPLLLLTLTMFGSLATSTALLASFILVFVFYQRSALTIPVAFLSIFALLVSVNALYIFKGEAVPHAINLIAVAFGKSTESIVGMTGRLELWMGIWNATKDQPWGFGFAALERTFSLEHDSVSWSAGNAHNGFVSAWLGAGFLAVLFVVALFASLWKRCLRLGGTNAAPLTASLLCLLTLNNFTLPVVGGRLTVVFLFVLALAHMRPHRVSTAHDIAVEDACGRCP